MGLLPLRLRCSLHRRPKCAGQHCKLSALAQATKSVPRCLADGFWDSWHNRSAEGVNYHIVSLHNTAGMWAGMCVGHPLDKYVGLHLLKPLAPTNSVTRLLPCHLKGVPGHEVVTGITLCSR